MITKTCKNCGFTVDIECRTKTCPVCKTTFDENYCRICGRYVRGSNLIRGTTCRACYDTVVRKPDAERRAYAKRASQYKAELNDWLSKIKKVPDNYPTLTEAQWIEACIYFGGCARCGNPDISSRNFFIRRRDGGRYCAWNIIPLCEECSLKLHVVNTNERAYNPFSAYRVESPPNTERLMKIKIYLEERLDEATTK